MSFMRFSKRFHSKEEFCALNSLAVDAVASHRQWGITWSVNDSELAISVFLTNIRHLKEDKMEWNLHKRFQSPASRVQVSSVLVEVYARWFILRNLLFTNIIEQWNKITCERVVWTMCVNLRYFVASGETRCCRNSSTHPWEVGTSSRYHLNKNWFSIPESRCFRVKSFRENLLVWNLLPHQSSFKFDEFFPWKIWTNIREREEAKMGKQRA